MLILVLGILIFLGVHSLTSLRETRGKLVERLGLGPYKGLYSLASAAGFALIVWGFARYQAEGLIQLWMPPGWTRPLAIVLMWFSFVALTATYAPAGKIKGWLRHPMLAAIKIWAAAHLLANGDLGALILFGSFLAWAGYDRIAVKKRGDFGAPRVESFTPGDSMALGIGTVAFVAMLFLHPVLIGVPVLSG